MSHTIDASKRVALVAILGFVAGIAAVVLTNLAEWQLAQVALPDTASWFLQCVVAGLTFALVSTGFSQQKSVPPQMLSQRVLSTTTFAFTLFLIAILIVAPKTAYRWLVVFYALAILCVWVAWHFVKAIPNLVLPNSTVTVWLNASRTFTISGLFLLTQLPFWLLTSQNAMAERTANWAYGFLCLAVGITGLHWLGWLKRLGALNTIGTSAFIVFLFAIAYYPVFTGPTKTEATFEVDTRPSYLEGRVTQTDILVSSSSQLRLGNLPNMPAHLDLRPDERGTALWDDLTRSLAGKRRVYWIQMPKASGDTQQVLATFLKTNGCLVDQKTVGLPVQVYELHAPFAIPRVLPPTLALRNLEAFDSAQVDFGMIQLTGARIESRVCSHDALAVALRWRLPQATESPLRVSFLLIDAKGRMISTQDFYINAPDARHTDHWQPGEESSDYYQVVVPFGTPPGTYRLDLAVYPENNPQRLRIAGARDDVTTLGSVQVYRADDYTVDPYNTLQESNLIPAGIELRDGLQLDAYGIDASTLIPGAKLTLTTQWRALVAPLPDYVVRVRLGSNPTIAETSGESVDNTYATSRWRTDESVVDRWELSIPRDSQSGNARLEVGIDGGKSVYLADVNIAPITRTLQMPQVGVPIQARFGNVAELVGYQIDQTSISTGKSLSVTLDWRAVSEPEQSYTVFAQLLSADDRLLAQSDEIPDNGARPTWSWIANEYVTDRHELALNSTNYQGAAKLIVGMYNSVTGERLVTGDGKSDFVVLPTPIKIGP